MTFRSATTRQILLNILYFNVGMALLCIICQPLIFLTRLRFPPGKSIVVILNKFPIVQGAKSLSGGTFFALNLLHEFKLILVLDDMWTSDIVLPQKNDF